MNSVSMYVCMYVCTVPYQVICEVSGELLEVARAEFQRLVKISEFLLKIRDRHGKDPGTAQQKPGELVLIITHVCTYVLYVCMYCMYVCTGMYCMFVCLYVCMFVCMHVYLFIIC